MAKLEQKLSRGRPKVTHGGFAFLTHGRLPEHRVELRRYLSACRQGLIEDLGGDLSTQETILVDRCISLLGIIRCVEEFCKEKGTFVNGNLQPSLGKHYVSYVNSLKQILVNLGLNKKDMNELSPLELAEQVDRENSVDHARQ